MGGDELWLTEDFAVPAGTGAGDDVTRLVLGGLPLAAGLRACAEETRSSQERRALLTIAKRLEQGEPIEEVLTDRGAFPRYLREMLAAGVQTGQLPRVLSEYLVISRTQQRANQQLWLSCAYPLVVFGLLLVVGTVVPLHVVPAMKEVFNSFGVELPWITQFIVAFSDLFLAAWPVFIGLFVLLVLSPWLHVLLPGRGMRQGVIYAIPLLGTAVRLSALSELCVMLALLVRARLPLPVALLSLSTTLVSRPLRRGCKRLAEQFAAGDQIRDLLYKQQQIPAEVLQLFTHAGQPDSLAEQLRLTGETYAAQSQIKLRSGLVLLEPFFLVCLAIGIGIVAAALFMPLIRLLNDLS